MKNILIVTGAADIHATAVSVALRSRGHRVVEWMPSSYPIVQDMTLSVPPNIQNSSWQLSENGRLVAEDNFDSIWLRRPQQAVLSNQVHRDDFITATRQANTFLKEIWTIIGQNAFWVNPYPAARLAEYKPLQLKKADEIGFSVPQTIFSNNPGHIRNFVREHDGQVVIKGIANHRWELEDGGCAVLYTNRISELDPMSDPELQVAPCIYQQLVNKECDLRVTYFGTRYFAVSIRLKQNPRNHIDWKYFNSDELILEPHKLPEHVDVLCQTLLREMNLVFGCFDFVLTPAGEYIFLEVNPAGQFLWIEEILPDIHLLDSFCDFLTGGCCSQDSARISLPARFPEVLWNQSNRPGSK